MKRKYLFIGLAFFICVVAYAANYTRFDNLIVKTSVSVGGNTPSDSNAVLALTSTTKGFLPPRMTTTQQNLIPTPSPGMTIYNTTGNRINFWNGSQWLINSTVSGVETLTNKTMSGASNTFTNIPLTSAVTGVLPVANGGTNSSSALNNNRVMQSSGGAVVEASAITASRALVSDSNGIPVASAVTTTTLELLDATSSVQTQLDARVLKSLYAAKASVLGASAASTPVAVPTPSADNQVLTSDTTQTSGLKWAAASASNVVLATSTKTANYTALTTDDVIFTNTNAFTVTLYAVSGNTGRQIRIRKIGTDFNIQTIDANGAETIEGVASVTLDTPGEEYYLVNDGSEWKILDHKIPSVWTSFTPTINFSSNISSNVGWWKRVGDSLLMTGYIAFSGSTEGTAFTVTLPNSWTIDTTKLQATTTSTQLGITNLLDSGVQNYTGRMAYSSSTVVAGRTEVADGTYLYSGGHSGTVPYTIGAGDSISWSITVPLPISGWTGH